MINCLPKGGFIQVTAFATRLKVLASTICHEKPVVAPPSPDIAEMACVRYLVDFLAVNSYSVYSSKTTLV
ncbi:hypothetical protein TNCV_4148831 [Trichonephila clavipes]|nr:hypothetical protein TNCV_4148831 [Trichonephila clavipes]